LLSGPLEAGDQHVSLSMGRDGSYFAGRVLLAGPSVGGVGYWAVAALVGWQEDMTTCFWGICGGVLTLDFDKHGPTYSWLKEFHVHLVMNLYCSRFIHTS
jgi:hypothetical protein